MLTNPTDSSALRWWTGLRLLRERPIALLMGSNTLSSIGTGMLLLLHGWLAVQWGHSPLFLLIFAVARLAPKIALTVPAGVISDKLARRHVLFASRCGYGLSALIAMVGVVAPMPLAWLLGGVVTAGAIHAFDLSSARAMLGDITPRKDIDAAVALSKATQQIAALAGPASAFLLISSAGTAAALGVCAALLFAGAAAILPLEAVMHVRRDAEAGGIYRYLRESPMTLLLLAAGIVPAFIDKIVALLLPSLAQGGGTTSLALMAPEFGALVMVSVLAIAPVRFSVPALGGAAVLYALLICTATVQVQEAEMLVVALGLAGMASAAINTTAHAGLQRAVPADMRGRVFAI